MSVEAKKRILRLLLNHAYGDNAFFYQSWVRCRLCARCVFEWVKQDGRVLCGCDTCTDMADFNPKEFTVCPPRALYVIEEEQV